MRRHQCSSLPYMIVRSQCGGRKVWREDGQPPPPEVHSLAEENSVVCWESRGMEGGGGGRGRKGRREGGKEGNRRIEEEEEEEEEEEHTG